jgi:hypothetical protein
MTLALVPQRSSGVRQVIDLLSVLAARVGKLAT